MRSGGSKQKGAAFERQICQRLSLWVTGGEQKDVFWRSAMSGGRQTNARKKGGSCPPQAGDISAVAPAGHAFCERFCAECKFYRRLEIDRLVFGFLRPEGNLADFWRQANEQCRGMGRQPFLVAKQNCQPVILATTAVGQAILNAGAEDVLTPRARIAEIDMMLFQLDDILEGVYWSRIVAPVGRVRIAK